MTKKVCCKLLHFMSVVLYRPFDPLLCRGAVVAEGGRRLIMYASGRDALCMQEGGGLIMYARGGGLIMYV